MKSVIIKDENESLCLFNYNVDSKKLKTYNSQTYIPKLEHDCDHKSKCELYGDRVSKDGKTLYIKHFHRDLGKVDLNGVYGITKCYRLAYHADSQVVNGCQFFKVFDDHQLEYILLACGDSEDVYMIGKIASFQIQNLLVAYKERFDKDNFIKNLILDNLLLVDIYNRAKKLHIETEVRRVVFLVETNREKDGNELEKIRGLSKCVCCT